MLDSCAPLQNLSITLTLAKQMVGRISNIVYDILRKLMNVRFLCFLTQSIHKIDTCKADVWISNIVYDILRKLVNVRFLCFITKSLRLKLKKQIIGFLTLIFLIMYIIF